MPLDALLNYEQGGYLNKGGGVSGAFKVYDHYKRPFLKGEKLFQKRGDNSKEVTYLCQLPNKMSTVINDKGLIECAMDFELSRIDATET